MTDDLNLPVELPSAENLLRGMNGAAAAAVGEAQRLSSCVNKAWQSMDGSILQTVQQAGRLAAMRVIQPAEDVSPLPGLTANTLRQAMEQLLSGLTISLDGEKVGKLVAPTVNQLIAASARERRYAG